MLSKDRNVRQGNWLFRWRSYLPLALIAIMLPAIGSYRYFCHSHYFDLIWEILCLAVSFGGLFIRCYTIGRVPRGTSGRNTKTGQIAESLNTTGIYSSLRNPLYFGNFFMMFGVVLFLHNFWVCLIFLLLFWIYYERIIFAEEEFLLQKFGQEYVDYASRTPAFFPSFRRWQKTNLPFSWKTVLKREYCGFLAMILCFFTLEIITDLVIWKRFVLDPVWTVLLIVATFVFLSLRFLKKHTKILDVEGR